MKRAPKNFEATRVYPASDNPYTRTQAVTARRAYIANLDPEQKRAPTSFEARPVVFVPSSAKIEPESREALPIELTGGTETRKAPASTEPLYVYVENLTLALFFGAKLKEEFGNAITFTRASSGTYFDSSGTLVTATDNVARIDHDPVTKAIKGLLIEESRQNVCLYSKLEGGGAAPTGWTQPTATGTSAPTTSLYGIADGAVAYTQSGTDQRPYLQSAVLTLSAGITYTMSVYVEAISGTIANQNILAPVGYPADSVIAYYRSGASVLGSATCITGRLYATISSATGGTVYVRAGLGCSGNTTGSVTFSRPQSESGSFPTSYIPTTTAAVTRAADICSLAVGSWFNASEGTIVAEGVTASGLSSTLNQYLWQVDDTTSNNRMMVYRSPGAGTVSFNVMSGGVSQAALSVGAGANSSLISASAGWKINDFAASKDGGAAVTDTSGSVPAGIVSLRIGSAAGGASLWNGHIRRILYFNRRLTNAELAGITT